MLKKFLSKLFTGLYVSSLLLTVMPQTAFADSVFTSLRFANADQDPLIELAAGINESFTIEARGDLGGPFSGTKVFSAIGSDSPDFGVTALSIGAGTTSLGTYALSYAAAGNYQVSLCFTETGAATADCALLDVTVTDPNAPLTGALTSSGPYDNTVGYQTTEGGKVPFDFLIEGVPNLPEIDADADGQMDDPAAYMDYTVNYGDGSRFSSSFPITSDPSDEYRIKDHTGFTGNLSRSFDFYSYPGSEYPENHLYHAGNYTLTVDASLRRADGQPMEGFTPLNISAPVRVYSLEAGPDFSVSSGTYNVQTDTVSVVITYRSPEPEVSFFTELADAPDALREMLLNMFSVEVRKPGSTLGTGLIIPFNTWEISTPQRFDGAFYTTEYLIEIQNAEEVLGYNPVEEDVEVMFYEQFSESLNGLIAYDGMLRSGYYLLDSNDRNFQALSVVDEPLSMSTAFSTTTPIVEVGEPAHFDALVSSIPAEASRLDVEIDFGTETIDGSFIQSFDLIGEPSFELHVPAVYLNEGPTVAQLCVNTDINSVICQLVSLTVIEDIPMSVAFQDEGMRVETGESFALSAFVDEIPEAATSISYEILDLSAGTFEGQSGTLALEEGETTAFIALNDLSLAELGGHELELCVQNDAEITPACTYLTVEVIPAPLSITSALDASSVDPGSSVMASFSFENVDPASANLRTTIQWGDGVTSTMNTDPAAYAGETLALSHVYSEEGSYAVQICGNDGREDACSTQMLTVEPPLDVRLSLEQTGVNQVAAHAVVSNLDADATTLPYTIDWGEGTVESFSDVANGVASLNLNEAFLYAAEGAYTVEICVQEAAEVACSAQIIDTTLTPLTLNVTGGETAVYTNQAQTLSLDAAGIASFTDALDLSVSWGDGTVEETTVAGADIAAGTYSLPITHAYTAAGTYTFEACGNDGRGELCNSSEVVVKLPLTLELTEPVITERTISVDSRVEGINAGVSALTYSYTWGDDSEQSFTRAVTPGDVVILGGEHTYAADGIYTAELCVTDGDQEACQTLNVSVALTPIVVDIFASEDPQFLGEDASIWLDATELFSGATTATVTTVWGDGSAPETLTLVLPTLGAELHGVMRHTYSSEGTYTIETCVNDGETQSCDSTTLQMVGNDLFASIDSFDAASGLLTYTLGNKGAQGVSSPALLTTQNELSLGEGLVVTQPWSADADLASYTAAGGSLTRTESFDLTELSGQTLTLAVCIDTELAVYDFDTENNCATLLVSIPEGTPGFSLTETVGNTQVSEDADTDTFSVVLTGEPTSNVVLKVTSGDTGEGTVSTDALTFTPENWNTAQTVTLTGVNDALADGTQVYFLTVSVSDEASAAAFAEVADQTVRAITTDNDGGRTSTEGGSGGGGGGGSHQSDRPSAGDENVELSSENPFTDLSADSPYFDAVMDLYGQGIVQGYEDGTFHAENITNRAEFMKLVVVSAGVEETTLSTYGNCFPDVTTQWYASYVCYGKEKGWIQGYHDGLFRPEQTINRVESIKMVVNVLGLEMKPGFAWDGQLFADTEAGAWYTPFVSIAYSLGLINQPADKLLHPADGMSRGALADLLSRALAL